MTTHTTLKVLNEVTDALRDLLAEHEQYWTSKILRGNKDRRAHLVSELIDNDPQIIAARRALTRAICVLDKAEQEAKRKV